MEDDALTPLGANLVRMMSETAVAYNDAMTDEVFDYLANRGIAAETANDFLLGYVDEPAPGHEGQVGWLAIPYLGISQEGVQEAWAIRFRCLPDLVHPGAACKEMGHGKYKGMAGEFARVFNTRALKEGTTEIHITEGELDTVILNQAGYPAIGLPGATQWRKHHRSMVEQFDRIYIWADPDEAGAKMMGDIMRACRRSAPVKLSVGDVTETFLAGGYEALDAAVAEVEW